MANKDIILFVNAIRPATFEALESYRKRTNRKFKLVVLVNSAIQDAILERNGQLKHLDKITLLSADFTDPMSLRSALLPIIDHIFAVTSQYENSIPELKSLIPYLPYLPLPTERSLDWSTEKKLMRHILKAQDSSLVPGFVEVTELGESTIRTIEKNLSYPVVVKPSGLEGSLLVSLAHNRAELQSQLEHIFKEISLGYATWIKRQKPLVLVEEFMVGDMFSVDTYVDEYGNCTHVPPVHVITGHRVGFDDFFGYMRTVPSGLKANEAKRAFVACTQACQALGLRSVTAHIELMRTAAGWKIIELGPRIGGYRHDIYTEGYGINHIANDIINRAGLAVAVPSELKKHTAVFNIYAPDEGILRTIKGIEAIQQLLSFRTLNQVVSIGEEARFAKNNGDPVLEIMLSNENKKQFESDVSALEKAIQFEIDPLETTLENTL